jgi:hypothetical protein
MGIGSGEDVVAMVGVAGRYGKKQINDFFSVPLLPGFFVFRCYILSGTFFSTVFYCFF